MDRNDALLAEVKPRAGVSVMPTTPSPNVPVDAVVCGICGDDEVYMTLQPQLYSLSTRSPVGEIDDAKVRVDAHTWCAECDTVDAGLVDAVKGEQHGK